VRAAGQKSVTMVFLVRGGNAMRVDIYSRDEAEGKHSYLAVPEGKPIPEEATNTDWQPEAQKVEVDDDSGDLTRYHIVNPLEQITAKGYAITGLDEQL
jgi:hypothetical protein